MNRIRLISKDDLETRKQKTVVKARLFECENGHVETGTKVSPIRCLKCEKPVKAVREVSNEAN